MAEFDIRQLEHIEIEAGTERSDRLVSEFNKRLVGLFFESDEAQELMGTSDIGVGFWANVLLDYGYNYEGETVTSMTAISVQNTVTETFPRKVSLDKPSDADSAIPELIQFWRYLERQHALSNASEIIPILEEIEPTFLATMNDLSKFGMAKSMFMLGKEHGFDMHTNEGFQAFTEYYNRSIAPNLARKTAPPPIEILPAGPPPHIPSGDHKSRKLKQKISRMSRSRNRRKRKKR